MVKRSPDSSLDQSSYDTKIFFSSKHHVSFKHYYTIFPRSSISEESFSITKEFIPHREVLEEVVSDHGSSVCGVDIYLPDGRPLKIELKG